MALSMTTTVRQIRELIADVEGITRVGAASEDDANALPSSIPPGDFPAVLVFPGPDIAYILSSGQHRHTYEVNVHVLCDARGDLGETAAQAMPLVDAIIEKFVGNVTLGNRANSCLYKRQTGLITLTFAGVEYPGWEIVLEVSEQASATPAVGS